MNKPSLIRYLYNEGMPQKLIQLVTKANQSYISKICSNKIRVEEKENPDFSEDEGRRYNVIQAILSAPSLNTVGLTVDDMEYIQLLKYCMVDKQVIRDLYKDLSENKFRIAYAKKSVDFRNFNSTLIGIELEDFDDVFGCCGQL